LAIGDLLQTGHDRREFLQQSATAKFLGVVKNNLDTEDAFAFGIDLESQLAEMEFKDRHTVFKFLCARKTPLHPERYYPLQVIPNSRGIQV